MCLFVALVYCGQTVRWIKMPLGADVGLGTGHIVLDGDPATSTVRRTADPHFSVPVYCVQIAGCIRMPLGTEVGLGPGDIVLDGDPASPRLQKGAQQLPVFGPLCCGLVLDCIGSSASCLLAQEVAWRLKMCLELQYSYLLSTPQCMLDGSRGNPTG